MYIFHQTSTVVLNRLFRLFIYAYLCCFVTACGVRGDGAGDDRVNSSNTLGAQTSASSTSSKLAPQSCEIADLKTWVHQNMLDYYLFYDQVERNPDFTAYDDTESLIADLRVQPYDSFSYITDESSHTALFTAGQTFGFGWVLERSETDEFYFQMVEPHSPFALANVQRGDQLLGIGGYSVAEFLVLPSAAKDALLGTTNEVVTVDFTIGKPDSETVTVSVTKAEYPVQTVLASHTINDQGNRIGYLHFYQFVDTSIEELELAFASLKAANINELVLDLRYNGGGRISVANYLASRVLSNTETSRTFTTYKPNDKYASSASSVDLSVVSDFLDIHRVFVLQGPYTCSASELVINGLRPYMEVITVGDTSCGKPYATIPNTACGKVMNALELDLVNANGSGGYYNGIAADCSVSEDVRQSLGDKDENLLAAAINYISTGSCGNLAQRSKSTAQALPQRLARPTYPGNTF